MSMEVLIEDDNKIFRLSKFLRDARRKSSNTLLKYLLLQQGNRPVYISQKYLQVQQQLPASSISSDLQQLQELGFPLAITKASIEMELQDSIIDPYEQISGVYKLYTLRQPFDIIIDIEPRNSLPLLNLGVVEPKNDVLLSILDFLRSPQKLQIVRFLLKHPQERFDKEELYSGVMKMQPNYITNTSERLINFSKVFDNPMFNVSYPQRIPHIGINHRGITFRFKSMSPDQMEIRETENIAYVAKSV